MYKIKIIVFIVLAVVCMSFPNNVSAQGENTSVLFQFDQTAYSSGDTIKMTFHLTQFTDLYGFQIDIKEDSAQYAIKNSDKPFVVSSQSIFTEDDHEWVNQQSLNGATVMYTRNLDTDFGYNYMEQSKLVEIHLIAVNDIADIYQVFTVSSNYNDLEYGDANVVVKLSDSTSTQLAYNYVKDNTSPVVTGLKNFTVEVNALLPDLYEGVTVSDIFDISPTITDDANKTVDLSNIGNYEVNFIFKDIYGNQGMDKVIISVVDTKAPEITLTGEAAITIEAGTTYHDPGATVTDNYDMNLEATVLGNLDMNLVGTYYKTYQVTDGSGNSSVLLTRTIIVVDTTSPVVSLEPGLDTIYVGETHIDGGIEYSDYEQEKFNIMVLNQVDANRIGEYTITYTVTDTSGNETIIKRYVNVLKQKPDVRFILEPARTTISINEAFTETGCQVMVNLITQECTEVSNTLDVSKPGVYKIIYSVTIDEATYTKSIYVFVTGVKTSMYYRKEEEVIVV